MGFVESNLMPNEEILYRAKFHWMIFFWPAFFLFCALMGYTSAKEVGNGFLILAVLTGINSFVVYSTSEFAVTNKRVLGKWGAIKRRSLDILLSKVESVQVNETTLGRIFGYATIVVRGSGGTPNPFYKIANPLELRNQVHMAVSSS